MKTLMRNGRDRRSENPRCATRGKNACFWLGPISGSHQGPQPERLHLEAGYMTAPVSFREKVRFFSLAPRAPSIHDPMYGPAVRCKRFSPLLAAAVLHQCIRSLIGASAPRHHGYQRACDLITG